MCSVASNPHMFREGCFPSLKIHPPLAPQQQPVFVTVRPRGHLPPPFFPVISCTLAHSAPLPRIPPGVWSVDGGQPPPKTAEPSPRDMRLLLLSVRIFVLATYLGLLLRFHFESSFRRVPTLSCSTSSRTCRAFSSRRCASSSILPRVVMELRGGLRRPEHVNNQSQHAPITSPFYNAALKFSLSPMYLIVSFITTTPSPTAAWVHASIALTTGSTCSRIVS